MTKNKNKYIREFYKTYQVFDGNQTEKKSINLSIHTKLPTKKKTTLTIKGYLEDEEISPYETMNLLNIDDVYEEFDFIPIFELRLGRGQLPNAIYIESRLAENLFFKATDVPKQSNKKICSRTNVV